MAKNLLVITGRHGTIFSDAKTGEIFKRIEIEPDHGELCEDCEKNVAYPDIHRFHPEDLADHASIWWNQYGIGHIDIVRIGYTINNGQYEPPSNLWGEEFQKEK